MDDEEASYATIGEPLYRVEAGNIEYRYDYNSTQENRAKIQTIFADWF